MEKCMDDMPSAAEFTANLGAVTEEWIEGMNYGIAWAKHIEQREANANPKRTV